MSGYIIIGVIGAIGGVIGAGFGLYIGWLGSQAVLASLKPVPVYQRPVGPLHHR